MFTTTLLKAEKWRYVLIAEAALPSLMLGIGSIWFAPKSDAALTVVGRPPARVFGYVWIFLIIIWTLSLVLSAMNLEKNLALLGVGLFSLFCLATCLTWLILYKKLQKELAYFALLGSVLFMALATVCGVSSNSISPNAKTFIASSLAIITSWLLFASNFALVELNI